MNKNNKVLLSTIGLLLLSGIAATSSTFAWFTTVRSASINYGSATVGTKEGSLIISNLTSTNATAVAGGSGNALTLTGTPAITDISGDGKDFYKPIWYNQTGGHTGSASGFSKITGADGNFVDFTVTVGRSNAVGETGIKVYLGALTNITATVQTGARDAVRLAVLDEDGEVVLRWAPVAEATAKYIATQSGGTAYTVSGFTQKEDTLLKSGAIVTHTTVATADPHGYLVATLASGVAKETNLTFRVWIEGEDAQTLDGIKGAVLSTNIDLYSIDIL